MCPHFRNPIEGMVTYMMMPLYGTTRGTKKVQYTFDEKQRVIKKRMHITIVVVVVLVLVVSCLFVGGRMM